MLALLMALAVTPFDNVPIDFQGKLADYHLCIRHYENAAKDRWEGPDPKLPFVMQFAQLMAYCKSDRAPAEQKVRQIIKIRHPDWSDDKLAAGSEYVLSGFEIDYMAWLRAKPDWNQSQHENPPARY